MALPNGPMEIMFSFDTTGSMSSCLDEVRGRVSDMVQRLQADIPGIRIAIFAHGDYCDKNRTYVTKYEDFTDDVAKLCDFVKTVGPTGGGDSDECYELVLYEARTKLSWTPGSQRALVMIGDCNPHEPNYPQNKLKLNWRHETDSLAANGVRIYAVQCGSYADSNKFYSEIAKRTDGQHLQLNDFKNIFDFLMTVCYREKGADFFDNYEKEVRGRCGPINKDLDNLFGALRDAAPSGSGTAGGAPSSAKIITPLKKLTSVKGKKPLIALKRKSPLSSTKKIAKSTPKVSKVFQKFTNKQLPLLRRENVPENNFMLNNLNWSIWVLAISPAVKGEVTVPRRGDACGFRTKQIFGGKTKLPALYEIAVQTHYRTRKFVVYSKFCRKGFMNGGNWEKRLLGRADIKKQIDRVVGKNCSIFIRRALLNSTKNTCGAAESLKRYDYAWKSVRATRKTHRPVTKMCVDISTEMEI